MHDPLESLLNKLRASGRVSVEEWPAEAPAPSLLGFVESPKGWFSSEHTVEYLDTLKFSSLASLPAETITVILTTESTNTVLMNRARDSDVHRTVLMAEHQASGRGRRGRKWLSPFGRSLSISIGYEFEGSGLRMQGLSLVVGLSVCKVLRQLGGTGCGLKWPNDVLYDGKKLCGILVEHQLASGINKYVVGIGLNIALTGNEMDSIDQPVCNVLEAGIESDRTTLAALVTKEVLESLERLQVSGFSAFRDTYESMHILHGVRVNIRRGDETVEQGVVREIGSDGALIVAHGERLESYVSGEVSVRSDS